MNNIKLLPSIIKREGVVAIYTTCGLGIITLPSSSQLKKSIPDLYQLAKSREVCLLIGAKTPLNSYLNDISEIAMTLLELSEKPVTLEFDDWIKSANLLELFDDLALRMVTNHDEAYIVNGVGQPLLFIPITQKELLLCKSLKGDNFLFEMAIQDQQNTIEKPGIIKFFSNGTMKVIRE